MKTIGTLLKETRRNKKITLESLEEKTKIKKRFLVAIEKEKWEDLPPYPTVAGFVTSISNFLSLNSTKTQAILRRDYTLQKTISPPKSSFSQKSVSFGPKIVFTFSAILVLLLICSYLLFQYYRFTSPPKLSLKYPQQDITNYNKLEIQIEGHSSAGSTIRVNNQPAIVDDEGKFTTNLSLVEGKNEIEIKAISRSNRETTIMREINVNLQNK
jgi:cytoskeletal protein RodZ